MTSTDEAFLAHFKGIQTQSLELVSELEAWLADPANRKEASQEELDAMKSLDMAELKKQFEERMKEQKGRHQGEPLDWHGRDVALRRDGAEPGGVAGRTDGRRSAMGIADARRFRPDPGLAPRHSTDSGRAPQAEGLPARGQPDELDLDNTIDATAKNAGELESRPVLRASRTCACCS